MQIYDPMCEEGAILSCRNSTGHFMLLDNLAYAANSIRVVTVWKLNDKIHGLKRDESVLGVGDEHSKKKKKFRKSRPNKIELIMGEK